MARKPETFFEQAKRNVGVTAQRARPLKAASRLIKPYLADMMEPFYRQTAQLPGAARVLAGLQRANRPPQVDP